MYNLIVHSDQVFMPINGRFAPCMSVDSELSSKLGKNFNS